MARKILLADDSVTAQNMGRKILADAGYEVTTVNNGSAALKKIAESRPDLIVLDVYMPGYSGLEVCQRLKENAETARIPILLTVGKLEPFKPEEARRVRAEGYIVKPFEASELLSALTKLEDKMVPHADSSKPGRFARAIAAVEEGRYDNTVAIDEDSGWKNRISFPSKKKKKLEPEDGDDPAIYNPVNKDLRTVVEPKSAPADSKPAESRVDVGALASEGLPKDVTPEEIAALAAAAAQVTKAISGHNVEPAPSQQVSPSEHKSAEDSAEKSESKVEAKGEAGVKVEASSSTAPAAESVSPKEEAPLQSSDQPAPAAEVASPVEATFAAGKVEDEHQSPISPLATTAVESTHLIDESALQKLSKAAEAEPVTMAVGPKGSSSRWTAVAVALSPEETGVSLDDEMRYAQGASVGASSGSAEPAAIALVAEVSQALAPSSVMITPPVAEPAASSFAEVAQALSAAASAAQQSVSAMVKEFENVAARSTVSPEPSESRQPVEEATPPAVESSATPVESRTQEPASQASAPIDLPPQPELAATVVPAPDKPQIEQTTAAAEVQSQESQEPEKSSEPTAVVASASTEAPATPALAEAAVASGPIVPESSRAAEAVAQVAEPQPEASGTSQPENESSANASDISWRRLREESKSGTETAASPEEAAMAVAAGAEKAPEPAQAESDEAPEIASIVDSVLADLRPKIVAEISKKLGKKK